MGFLDRLKRMLESSTEIKKEKVAETVKSKDINHWVQTQKKELAEEESEFLKQVNERILSLADELEKEVTALKEVDFDDINVANRAKMIIGTNLDHYIRHLSNLITTLRELNISTTDNLLENITLVFRNFEQMAIKNFQKAASLAGHKLNDIGVSTGRFFTDMRKLMKENDTLINRAKIIHAVSLKLDEIDTFEKTKLEFKSNVDVLKEKIVKLEQEKQRISKEILTVKTSKSYATATKKREDFEKDKTELTKSIYALRKLIDFKLLSNTFHSSPKQLAIVRDYKSNFEEAFTKDSGQKLISLLKEADVSKGAIMNNINKITKTRQKIENTVIETDQIAELNQDITKITNQIEELTSKKELEQKKHDKFQTSRDNILDSIRSKLSKINVVLE
jgi:hypothetical protein